MLGKQSFPATRQGKIKGMGGEGGEEQSLFSPRCPWRALPAEARVSGLNCCISWATSRCLASHCPPCRHANTLVAGWCATSPLLGKAWGQSLAIHGCSLLHGRAPALRDRHWALLRRPRASFACSSQLSKRFYF